MTGGAGFIGSHTVVELLEKGLLVIVIDNMTNATASKEEDQLPPVLQRIKDIVTPEQSEKLHFVKGSFGDTEVLDRIFTRYLITTVIHFGGFKAVGESKELPMLYYSNNVGETVKLILCMQKHNVTNMIFSSSATVYSAPGPDDLPLTESAPTGNCTCPYASTKFFIENMLQDLCFAEKDWTVISLRYFNPVGAHSSGKIGEDPKGIPNNLMPYIAQVAVNRRSHLNVYGYDYPTKDGTGVRDYVHVVDLAKGHTAALDVLPNKKGFHKYNLGTGVGTSVLEMLKYFGEAIGRELPHKICERRPGDIAVMYCDASLAAKELGWTATKSVKEMCEDLWKFQSKNPNGYLS